MQMDHKQIGVPRQTNQIDYAAFAVGALPTVVTVAGTVYLARRGNYGFAALLMAPTILTVGAVGTILFLVYADPGRGK